MGTGRAELELHRLLSKRNVEDYLKEKSESSLGNI